MTTEFKIYKGKEINKPFIFIGIILVIIVIILLLIYFKNINPQSSSTNTTKSTATTMQVIQDNSDKNLYPTFVEGTGEQQFKINNPSLNYNPSKNILTSNKFKGDLIGNADSSTKSNKIVISEI